MISKEMRLEEVKCFLFIPMRTNISLFNRDNFCTLLTVSLRNSCFFTIASSKLYNSVCGMKVVSLKFLVPRSSLDSIN